MKILYIITKSNYGGAQKYVFELANHFNNDYEVAVAFGGTGSRGAKTGRLEGLLREHGIRTIFVKNFVRNVRFFSDVHAFFELVSLLKKERPDVVHLNSSKAGALGVLAARFCRIPRIIFTSHGLTYLEKWRPFWQRVLILWITWLTILLSHKTVMISAETTTSARNLPFLKHKVSHIYNGITEPIFLTKNEARATLSKKGSGELATDTLWIGTIAELHPNKNLDRILDILPDLQDDTVCNFVVMGEGEMREKLEAQATELGVAHLFHPLGFVPEAARYLKAFDIFVLPSSKEGFPYVLLEAGLASLPVVATDIPGNTDIIDPRTNGLLAEQNPDALKGALLSYLRDPKQAQYYGIKLREKIQNIFSIENMIESTCRLYMG